MSQRHTLLILDDDPHVRSALARLFRADGYRLLEASRADEALALLEDNEVGVLLCEPHIPEAGQFLSQARERFPLVQRLVLSGYTALQSVTDAINQGAVHKFFTKPWEDDALRAAVREAFARFEEAREAAAAWAVFASVKEESERRVARKLLESIRALAPMPFSAAHADDLPVGVLMAERGGRVMFANQKARLLLDASPGAAVSLPSSLERGVAACFDAGEGVWGEAEGPRGALEYYCQRIRPEGGGEQVMAVFLPNVKRSRRETSSPSPASGKRGKQR